MPRLPAAVRDLVSSLMRAARCASVVAAALAAPHAAIAQIRLPSLPSLRAAPINPTPLLRQEPAPATQLVRQRAQRIARLLQERRSLVEADAAGEPVVRGEVVLASPSELLLSAARAEGFSVLRDRLLEDLDLRWVTLGAPAGWDTARAVRRLRELDPDARVDFNHLYLDSGDVAAPTAGPDHARAPASPGDAWPGPGAPPRIGLIDGGVETAHPALRGADIRSWGCRGARLPSAHGTAIASLLVGRSPRFQSAAPGATLYAADVYCNEPVGGSVEAVALALSWLMSERVPVVNISLVGPANRLLETVVRRATDKGMLLVAAVGNDGPAAPPLYPAGYAPVVAVTGVDARARVLPEACRGPHVAFAAPGADMAVAARGDAGFGIARGTSFAAPLVAGLLATHLREPDAAQAALAVAALARSAIDLGEAGRDPVYGHGLVGRELRTEPERVSARAN